MICTIVLRWASSKFFHLKEKVETSNMELRPHVGHVVTDIVA